MSQSTLMPLLDAFLQDPQVGLAARIALLSLTAPRAVAVGPDKIRYDFRFVEYQPTGVVQPTNGVSVVTETVEYRPMGRIANLRDAVLVARITVEYPDADQASLLANRDLCADALGAMLLDGFRDYSDAHHGTVVEVAEPVVIQEGQFQGAVTSGLVATASILERTAYVP